MKSKKIKKGVNNFFPKDRKAAMEMSVGTIVTIVLLMSVLILGIFLVQKIFSSSTNAIDTIDNEVQNQINQLFKDDNAKTAIYPPSNDINVKKGEDPKGFAFSVRNNGVEEAEFSYTLEAADISKCGSTMTEEKANSYLLAGDKTFNIGPGDMRNKLVRFDVPEDAPPCTIVYQLEIQKAGVSYDGADIFVTIK